MKVIVDVQTVLHS